MKPLLWKEYRELRTTLLVWLACLAIVQALRQVGALGLPADVIGMLFNFIGVLSGVAIGSELLTRERHARTLDYLMARPVAAGSIVGAKFIAGSVMLLVFAAALLALVFLPAPRAELPVGLVNSTLQAGYWASLAAVFPRFWSIMALTLALSAVAGSRGKTTTAALLLLLGSYGVLVAASESQLWLDPAVWLGGGLHDSAHLLLTQSPALLLLVSGVWCSVAVVATALAATLFARRPYGSLGWLLIVGGGGVFCFLVPNLWQSAGLGLPSIQPVGVYRLASSHDSILAADGSRVCVVSGPEVIAVDFSDPARPKRLADVNLPLWTFTSVRVQGTRVLLAGRHKEVPDDRAGVLVFDLASPQQQTTATLGVAGGRHWQGSTELVGGYLYAGAGTPERAALRVFDLTGGTAARETAVIIVDETEEPSARFAGPLQFGMALRGTHGYIASTGTLTTLDVHDPAHPRLVRRTRLAPAGTIAFSRPQQVAFVEGRLAVENLWPKRLLAFSLADSANPTPAQEYSWQLPYAAVLGTPRGSLAVCLPSGARPRVFSPRPGLWPGRVRQLEVREPGTIRPPERLQAAFGDYLYILIDGGRLAAYDVAGGV